MLNNGPGLPDKTFVMSHIMLAGPPLKTRVQWVQRRCTLSVDRCENIRLVLSSAQCSSSTAGTRRGIYIFFERRGDFNRGPAPLSALLEGTETVCCWDRGEQYCNTETNMLDWLLLTAGVTQLPQQTKDDVQLTWGQEGATSSLRRMTSEQQQHLKYCFTFVT